MFYSKSFRLTLAVACVGMAAQMRPSALDAAEPHPGDVPLLIVPFNYDPLDPLAYMRKTGDAALAPVPSRQAGMRSASRIRLAAQEEIAPAAPVADEDAVPVPEDVAAAAAARNSAIEGPKLGPDAPWALPAQCLGPFMSYTDAYESIPYSRTEYEANPSYRQEAAMELMFRTLRPTTIVKQNTPYTMRYPDFYRYPFSRYPNFQRLDVHQFGGFQPGVLYPSYAQ